ncbi:MAG: hypothetical protein IJ272_05235 [Clostridia bacterium]|nr:hypothetical protein [Clostridia bacterium]
MTRAEWVIKVLSESAEQELPRAYRVWLHENVTSKNIRVCIEDCVCRELDWTNKYGHKGVLYLQDDKLTLEKKDIDMSKQALVLMPYFFETSNPYYLVVWYNPAINKCENASKSNAGALNVKRFKIPTFEEWQQKNNDVQVILGAYRVEIRATAWRNDSTLYGFAMALANSNPHNIYTERLFCDRFRYEGDVQKLKEWYESTVEAFHDFWKNHIKSTYLQN